VSPLSPPCITAARTGCKSETVGSAVRSSKEDKADEIARRKEEKKQARRKNNCLGFSHIRCVRLQCKKSVKTSKISVLAPTVEPELLQSIRIGSVHRWVEPPLRAISTLCFAFKLASLFTEPDLYMFRWYKRAIGFDFDV
jgi:hypothetical protein